MDLHNAILLEQLEETLAEAPNGATHVAKYIDNMFLKRVAPLGMKLYGPFTGEWAWCRDTAVLRNARDLSDLREIVKLLKRISELEQLQRRVAVLEEAITASLEGELLDELGNRDDNGLYRYPDLKFVMKTLGEALKDGES